ncbi:ABC transporter ATP-binding protein [Sinorhizobium alkalisoli]|uniref:ABC transporter ATP-binding protein n=1 Tax=Sinorhizobium alkalisoli TaxID=1752398 RepID=A0A1E3VE40_9HYPH|nr:ABC transporter ATP-binding protein [Sinorhizobium alkalisoli]MCA1494907.1 ABC transporter ATP-binding protein [Ensifer sp. NBAIM29]MCG5479326.1 ABC transporter ATP-binding protein [Sinorhizobium alkalisoli]ODR91707.1 ABC transporter ATP-binding protein [Sinorhizobium alkalisoli]QFI67422.1 Putrescine transport ATP-binding protein PotA [Sinorhizobium alkalisoli]
MSGLELQNVVKEFGAFRAVNDVDLTVPHGTFVCMLGPSGCGKTTLLRMIAGLDLPSSGAIRLDGDDITRVPTHKRNLGMVFQSLALFPHLTVGENIAYPLRIRKAQKEEQRRRVDELLSMIHLPGYADRPVSKLSGGQRQRVAIARALAISPKLFLLDEPLSALDAKLREAMQVELRQLQQKLGITTIVVTHDQREAMTMADTVVVMNGGEIRQAASPIEIYRRPADSFVADFIGQTNLIEAEADGQGRATVFGQAVAGLQLPPGARKATISIRPEDVHLTAPGAGALSGTVTFVRDLGGTIETFIDVAGHQIVAVSTPRARPQVSAGQPVGVALTPDVCVVLGK